MIGQLTGKVSFADEHGVILDVQGVGYQVALTNEAIATVGNSAERVTLWTHLAVREQALDLYGFVTKDELDFFELMISVSGIGPKKALAILSLAPISVLREAIVKNNASYLTKVSGVGRKNAEKIVLELHDKIGTIGSDAGESPTLHKDDDVLAAIHALGYSLQEGRDAIKLISPEVIGVQARIKEALRVRPLMERLFMRKGYPPIQPETRALLAREFASELDELSRLTGLDFSLWK